MLQSHQRPTKSQEMTEFRYYTVILLLKKFQVTPENLAAFRELLPPKSEELRVNEIFFGKYSFVLI